jgi:hypothetical protein
MTKIIPAIFIALLLMLTSWCAGDEHSHEHGQPEFFCEVFHAPAEQQALGIFTPDFNNLSGALVGSVAVGVIFVESNGSRSPQSENWTPDEIERAKQKIQMGLGWWAQNYPRANLSFEYEFTTLETGIEPVQGYAGYNYAEFEWVHDLTSQLGYGKQQFASVRRYVHDLRTRLGTTWGFALFMVDGSEDEDGCFADGRLYAYTYLGGPFIVAINKNSGWGEDLLDMTLAHELGHVFYALDEYPNSCTCGTLAGRTGKYRNDNCAHCPGSKVPCIMVGGPDPYFTPAICEHTRGMMGWRETPTFSLGLQQQVLGASTRYVLHSTWEHYGWTRPVELYVVLEFMGSFYSFPTWQAGLQGMSFEFPTPIEVAGVPLFEYELPNVASPIDGMWHGALFDALSGELYSYSATALSN